MSAFNAAAEATTDGRALDERLFVISGDNAWVHIYPDIATMLECKDTTAASPGSLDFFDVQGRRLGPVFSATWLLEGLRVTSDKANESLIRDRLCAVIESIKASLERRLAAEPNPPGDLAVALARLPGLTGKSLPDCYALLESNFGDGMGMRRDDGSVWHNFWCH